MPDSPGAGSTSPTTTTPTSDSRKTVGKEWAIGSVPIGVSRWAGLGVVETVQVKETVALETGGGRDFVVLVVHYCLSVFCVFLEAVAEGGGGGVRSDGVLN